MYKVLVLFVLTLASVATSQAVELKKSSTVLYSDSLVLTRKMFKGKPYDKSYMICTSFEYDYKIVRDSVFVNAFSFMKKKESRPKKNVFFEERLLQHELYHLKITELWARIFCAKLSGKEIKKSNLNVYLNQQYRACNKECASMQDLYDKETNHSKIEDKQNEWELKIDNLLEEYKDYANRDIVIKLKYNVTNSNR